MAAAWFTGWPGAELPGLARNHYVSIRSTPSVLPYELPRP